MREASFCESFAHLLCIEPRTGEIVLLWNICNSTSVFWSFSGCAVYNFGALILPLLHFINTTPYRNIGRTVEKSKKWFWTEHSPVRKNHDFYMVCTIADFVWKLKIRHNNSCSLYGSFFRNQNMIQKKVVKHRLRNRFFHTDDCGTDILTFRILFIGENHTVHRFPEKIIAPQLGKLTFCPNLV